MAAPHSSDGKKKVRKVGGRSGSGTKVPKDVLRPTQGNRIPRATKASTAAADLGAARRGAAVKAAAAFDKPSRPHNKKCGPPVMTASYVMGVQRRPKLKRTTSKSACAQAELLSVAAKADQAEEAIREAKACVAAAVWSARAAASTGQKKKGTKAGALASRAAARVAGAREALGVADRLAAHARRAQTEVKSYRDAWQNVVGTSWTDEAVPVGHKLKQLCRACGATLSDEAFSLIFSSLGGVGSTVNFHTFLGLMIEHSPNTRWTGKEPPRQPDKWDPCAPSAPSSH